MTVRQGVPLYRVKPRPKLQAEVYADLRGCHGVAGDLRTGLMLRSPRVKQQPRNILPRVEA